MPSIIRRNISVMKSIEGDNVTSLASLHKEDKAMLADEVVDDLMRLLEVSLKQGWKNTSSILGQAIGSVILESHGKQKLRI